MKQPATMYTGPLGSTLQGAIAFPRALRREVPAGIDE